MPTIGAQIVGKRVISPDGELLGIITEVHVSSTHCEVEIRFVNGTTLRVPLLALRRKDGDYVLRLVPAKLEKVRSNATKPESEEAKMLKRRLIDVRRASEVAENF